MTASYPGVDYKVVELPRGPKGSGTLQFTNCWGIAKDSKNQKAALSFVEKMTSTDQQLIFAKDYGVMPSVESAASKWKQEYPSTQRSLTRPAAPEAFRTKPARVT